MLAAELSLHGEALKGVIRKNGWSLPVQEAMWRTLRPGCRRPKDRLRVLTFLGGTLRATTILSQIGPELYFTSMPHIRFEFGRDDSARI
jgi:hypothetical protein